MANDYEPCGKCGGTIYMPNPSAHACPAERVDAPQNMEEFIDLVPPDAASLPCPKCEEKFPSGEDLCVHLVEAHHWNVLAAGQFAHAIADPAPSKEPKLRPRTDMEDDAGDYPTFADLLADLRMDAKEYPNQTVNRYEWYHEQIGKLLSRTVAPDIADEMAERMWAVKYLGPPPTQNERPSFADVQRFDFLKRMLRAALQQEPPVAQ